MARHGACGKSWTGYRTEHCPASGCHETFSGQSTGDAHRVGDHNDGRRCLSPDEMRDKGLVLDSRGIWSTKEWTPPILTPSALAARARRAEPGISGTPGPDGDIW
jgi:hypothetical protein